MATKAGGGTAKIVFGALVGATTGMALYLWVSPYIVGRCLVICSPYRSVIVLGLLGGVVTALVDRASGITRRLSEKPGGAAILRRRRQRRALWTGAVFFALMAICPPWTITRLAGDGRTQLTHPTHYRLLWHPPSVKKDREAASLDIERLLVQWAMVAAITGVAVATAAISEKDE